MSGLSTSSTVALARCESYEPEGIGAALDEAVGHLGGWTAFATEGERLLLKPNLLKGALPEAAVTTHPEVLRAVGRALKAHGAEPFVGDSPAWGTFKGVVEKTGIGPMARQEEMPLVGFTRGVKVDNHRGRVYEHFTVDGAALEADGIINCPKLKTHEQLYISGAVKNVFGCVTGMRKAWWHLKAGNFDNYFARMLIEVCELLKPRLHVMDGVVAMEGRGPGRGTPKPMNFIAASTDPVALDRVCLAVMGGEAERLKTLEAAAELGVGEPRLERIRVVGRSIDDFRVDDLLFPTLIPIGFSLPRVVKSTLKRQWTMRVAERHL